MLLVPFIIFWVLMFLGRSELGSKGILVSITIWIGLLLGFMTLNISPYLFVGAQSLFDIILILVIFGGDIRIG
jgi:hypothetical protein